MGPGSGASLSGADCSVLATSSTADIKSGMNEMYRSL